MIVQGLRKIQNQFGYLPDAELEALARQAGVPLAKVEEVASFFPAFRQEGRNEPADVEFLVCQDYTCHLRGADKLLAPDGLPKLAADLAQKHGRSIHVAGTSCLGRCDRAPAVWVERFDPPMPPHEHAWVYCGRSPADLHKLLGTLASGDSPPSPDTDTRHKTNTNADLKYSLPVVDRASRGAADHGSHDPVPAADWEINPYGRDRKPPSYEAVRKFIAFVEARGGKLPEPPALGGKELDKFVEEHHPLLWEMKQSNVLGMGGAGAPAYGKWLDVWQQSGPEKYIVANGDESEPGTFKDRELMLRLPHLIVEGVILAGLCTGATKGYIYVRHEYFEQIHALRAEIERAEHLGACGADIFDSGISFTVEVFESPGGYICGEQSALIEAMEDRRSQPRNRPPELASNGLRDKPTVVNNVETLAWAPYIMLRGGAEYAAAGWRVPWSERRIGFGGRRLFSVSGDVKRPGVYEVPIGLPLKELLYDPKYCGGVTGMLKAVAASGPSGGFLPAKIPLDPQFRARVPDGLKKIAERSKPDAEFMAWFIEKHLPAGTTELDLLAVPLDLNFFRHLHATFRFPVEPMLGAGLAVYAGAADILDHAVNFTRFYRNESCGKCVPCRLGSQKLLQIGLGLLGKRDAGKLGAADVRPIKELVADMTKTLQQTSICGLGYVAPIPLATALAYFAPDVLRKPRA